MEGLISTGPTPSSLILTFNIFYYSPAFYIHGHNSVMSEIAMLFQTMQNLIPKPCQFSSAHHGENKRRQTENNLQFAIGNQIDESFPLSFYCKDRLGGGGRESEDIGPSDVGSFQHYTALHTPPFITKNCLVKFGPILFGHRALDFRFCAKSLFSEHHSSCPQS